MVWARQSTTLRIRRELWHCNCVRSQQSASRWADIANEMANSNRMNETKQNVIYLLWMWKWWKKNWIFDKVFALSSTFFHYSVSSAISCWHSLCYYNHKIDIGFWALFKEGNDNRINQHAHSHGWDGFRYYMGVMLLVPHYYTHMRARISDFLHLKDKWLSKKLRWKMWRIVRIHLSIYFEIVFVLDFHVLFYLACRIEVTASSEFAQEIKY